MSKNWYVVITPTNKEETTKSSLEQRIQSSGMDVLISKVLVPKERTTEMRGKQKKIVERKKYPGYIFVEMEMNEETWLFVKETPGVAKFLGDRNPTSVKPPEIEQILLGDVSTTATTAPDIKIKFKKGDNVRIKEGPFESFEGMISEVISSKGMVKVNIIVFNRPTAVELGYWQIEAI
ncbi:MAG: transcription termination/antitermination protein NusG [Planctomycetota bacterium]|nr:transcription termination/antitermination protein NusG [Planctomycetota bacterium]MDI6787349.1 transcription termination/antitermination protein NusG [Planctomycetota bacterium]